ncbi:MAG: signal peptidase I [Planctomycetota bacterium]
MTIEGLSSIQTTSLEILSEDLASPKILWWRENLNFFILAFLILFLIRFYCVEFFLIPSQSMYPTLYGHPHSGDRILVNRAAYDFSQFSSHQIRRWEVIVFKFPLNLSRNFVKRVVALPGETVEIRSSNIWIQKQIATKPPEIQDHLFFENGRNPALSFLEFFHQNFQLTPHQKPFRSIAKEGVIQVSSLDRATALYVPQNSYAYDKDTKIHLRFLPLHIVGSLQITLTVGNAQAVLIVRETQIELHVLQDEKLSFSQKIPFNLLLNQTHFLEFAFVDSQINARLDEQELFPVYRVDPSALEIETRFFQLDFFQMECKLQNIRVFYDIRYTRDIDHLPYAQVQSKEYFVCGDNSVESDDSRNWRKIFLSVQRFGQTFFYEGQAEQSEKMWKENGVVFVDTLGKQYHFFPGTVKVVEKKPFPGVPKSYILGKAWLIIWPPDRMQWIR